MEIVQKLDEKECLLNIEVFLRHSYNTFCLIEEQNSTKFFADVLLQFYHSFNLLNNTLLKN